MIPGLRRGAGMTCIESDQMLHDQASQCSARGATATLASLAVYALLMQRNRQTCTTGRSGACLADDALAMQRGVVDGGHGADGQHAAQLQRFQEVPR